jgi:hypothetical protein
MASIPDFKNFQWSWPGNHQPLHAIMILLLDLVQTPDGENAQESRRAIDVAFALCGPNGGIVAGGGAADRLMKRPLTEGGQEAWVYFRRLRAKAWQKAGLDPDIVWTRAQAVQYCNQQPEPEMVTEDAGPMWSPSASMVEGFEHLDAGVAAAEFEVQGLARGALSPPNIDCKTCLLFWRQWEC